MSDDKNKNLDHNLKLTRRQFLKILLRGGIPRFAILSGRIDVARAYQVLMRFNVEINEKTVKMRPHELCYWAKMWNMVYWKKYSRRVYLYRKQGLSLWDAAIKAAEDLAGKNWWNGHHPQKTPWCRVRIPTQEELENYRQFLKSRGMWGLLDEISWPHMVDWNIVVLDVATVNGTEMVKINPQIRDLKYQSTPYPVGHHNYPEGELGHLSFLI